MSLRLTKNVDRSSNSLQGPKFLERAPSLEGPEIGTRCRVDSGPLPRPPGRIPKGGSPTSEPWYPYGVDYRALRRIYFLHPSRGLGSVGTRPRQVLGLGSVGFLGQLVPERPKALELTNPIQPRSKIPSMGP